MAAPSPQRRVPPVLGPGLRKLLFAVFALFALLSVDSVYLVGIRLLEWSTGRVYQDYTYQIVFLVHLAIGLALIAPAVVFGALHFGRARHRRNRHAVKAGIALYITALVLLFSGVALTRFGFFEIHDPRIREISYWIHVITPLMVVWLFVLHRLAGPRIRWRIGLRWAAVAAAFAAVMMAAQLQLSRPRAPGQSASGAADFSPSLARTASGGLIPSRSLMMDEYCAECHKETHEGWKQSVHHFSSFNNPAYRFSVLEAREVLTRRDGSPRGSRFCAGCHDPVPLFSGAFDQADFDIGKPTARAGLTCSACHAITRINTPRGNADYTIEEPEHYPFTFSTSPFLKAVNRQLIKAKPEFHKKTFLKPLHGTPEFCGTCHKVHLPEEINHYKWLRGQDHYDAYLLSGVSGHGASSFYYPPRAVTSCAGCHMPAIDALEDFGARHLDDSGQLKVHDHMFAAANTAIPHMTGLPAGGIEARQRFMRNALSVDIFGIREGGTIEGELHAPVRPELPTLRAGRRYLLETVVRTLKPGHVFTQGTADSNEIWLDVTLTSAGRVIGRSGAMDSQGGVDPWSHFLNAYVLDREGNRIDRRNGQDIYVALYNHQIPPGAADVVHYQLEVPADTRAPVTVDVKLQYRKFDTTYLRYIQGEDFRGNDLPVTTIAHDRVTFPVAGSESPGDSLPPPAEAWVRWNDYGIGLLRKGNSGSSKGELRQAEHAFSEVERLGQGHGPLNLARVYIKEGRLDDAAEALQRATGQGAYPWTVAWYTGLVNKQNGFLDAAIGNFTDILQTNYAQARARGFDFSRDYRVINELAQTLFERAKQARGPARSTQREALLKESVKWFNRTLELDPENVSAHYNLSLLYARLGDREQADTHRRLHLKYKPDDNARARPVAIHRRNNPAADHAAEAVVVYDLNRGTVEGIARAGDTEPSRRID